MKVQRMRRDPFNRDGKKVAKIVCSEKGKVVIGKKQTIIELTRGDIIRLIVGLWKCLIP